MIFVLGDKAVECREQAAACFAAASQMSLVSDRQRMTAMGEQWLRLAEAAASGQPH